MENKREISPVTDNKDKQDTYKYLLGRYKTAVKNKFYFEALLIVYALMEDRLRSYLYYIGALRKKDSFKLDVKLTKSEIKSLYVEYRIGSETDKLNISNISVKMNLIKSTLLWAADGCENADNDKYLSALIRLYENADTKLLLETLDSVSEWCRYRNEVIHSVMNKNLNSLNSELGSKVEEGMAYARIIDNAVKKLKTKNTVRKALKLGNM